MDKFHLTKLIKRGPIFYLTFKKSHENTGEANQELGKESLTKGAWKRNTRKHDSRVMLAKKVLHKIKYLCLLYVHSQPISGYKGQEPLT